MKKRKKKQKFKPRNFLVPLLRFRKAGEIEDAKKKKDKYLCREEVEEIE